MVLVFTLHRKDDVEDDGSLKVVPDVQQQDDGIGVSSGTHHSSDTNAGNPNDWPNHDDNVLNSVAVEDSDVD